MGTSELALVLLASAVGTQFLLGPARRLARQFGLVDHPSWRRSQTEAVPCSGGLAVYAAVAIGGFLLYRFGGLPFDGQALLSMGIAGLAIIGLGVADDRFGLHAEKKLLGQILVVALPLAGGLTLEQLFLPGIGMVELGIFGGPVTLFWYLGFINSMNLIDGLDGLASGITAIVLSTLGLLSIGVDPLGAAWVLLLLGSVLGFLRGNLSSDRIFLGDAGSMLLGLWVGGLAIGLSANQPAAPAIAAFAMLIPILDTATTIYRRWRRGYSLFHPDAEHLHHRLVRLGCAPRRAVAVLCFLTLAAAAGALGLSGQEGAGIFALGALAAAAIELAWTLPREGRPSVRSVASYLLGLRPLESLESAHSVSELEIIRLAEVIEISALRARHTEESDTTSVSAQEDASPKAAEPNADEAQEASKGVVLALGEDRT